MKYKFAMILVSGVLLFTACKKNKVTPTSTPTPTPVNPVMPTRAELSKDSIFLYAKQIYLWNDAIPTYEVFNPRQYMTGATDLAVYNSEVYAISQFKINPSTGRSFEYVANSSSAKYSYVFDKTNKNPTAYIPTVSSVDLEGNGNDLGAKLGLYGSTSNYTTCFQAVYQNSPADKAGLKRGDRITKINGTAIGSNYAAEVDLINTFFTATTMALEGLKADGTPFSVTLTKAVYKSSPIYSTKIFTSGAKKIGYLAYARFSTLANSQAEFDAAFANFASAGITDLIVDLRYNGGGYVNTAQYLINLIAPASLNGSVMFYEYYNSMMQNGQATILANQPLLDANNKTQYSNGKIVTYADVSYSVQKNTEVFSKKGSLNAISNVVFLVTGSTASASELVINSLKPHVNVTLIGQTTYGKPVGFFPITIENRYDVYFSLFQTKNVKGEGDYFAGFTPEHVLQEFVNPTPTTSPIRNFGDPAEIYVAKALSILAPGITGFSNTGANAAFSKNILSVVPDSYNSVYVPAQLPLSNRNEFLGMIETRHKLK